MDMNQSNMAFKASSSGSHLHNFMQVQNPMAPQNQQSTFELNNALSQENLQQRQARMQQLTKQHLARFWLERLWEMDNLADHRQHMLPLARIKKVMKSDDEVKMISADAPMLFSKAAEMFILELTLRSWMHTEIGNRRTLQRDDVANAISDTQVFDFLLDIVPREEDEEDEAPEGQAMPPQNVNYFPMLNAHLVQQQHNAAEQMTDRNAGWNAPVMPGGLNFPVVPTPNPLSMSPSPNQFSLAPPYPNQFSLAPLPSQLSLSSTPNEDLMLGNPGGESSRRSPGTYFPFLDAERYHFNYNPVTDEEMGNRPGVEMQSEPPSGGFLGMLGLNSFNNNVNFPQNYNPCDMNKEN